jgi:hypothetical protein
MLVVTNLVLPCATISNKQCYDTTRQRSHFARGLLDFSAADTAFFAGITDLNIRLRKLSAPSETAYLSHSCAAPRQPFNGADSGAQTPPRGVFRAVTVAVPTHTCKRPQKPVFAQKKRGENEQ